MRAARIVGVGVALGSSISDLDVLVDECENSDEIRMIERKLSAVLPRIHELIEKCHDKRARYAAIEGSMCHEG